MIGAVLARCLVRGLQEAKDKCIGDHRCEVVCYHSKTGKAQYYQNFRRLGRSQFGELSRIIALRVKLSKLLQGKLWEKWSPARKGGKRFCKKHPHGRRMGGHACRPDQENVCCRSALLVGPVSRVCFVPAGATKVGQLSTKVFFV